MAYKNARLEWKPGGEWRLKTGQQYVLSVDTLAVCSRNPDHQAPVSKCQCGFHGLMKPAHRTGNYGPVRLDVEFSGRVAIHETGYRAQHQRILEVHCPSCWYCGKTTVSFAVIEEWQGGGYKSSPSFEVGEPRPLCEEHQGKFDFTVPLDVVNEFLAVPFGKTC